MHEADLIAKVYYAKHKLVWEVLDGPLKSKIEVQWSDIAAIRAFIQEGQPGILEIEVRSCHMPPTFLSTTLSFFIGADPPSHNSVFKNSCRA